MSCLPAHVCNIESVIKFNNNNNNNARQVVLDLAECKRKRFFFNLMTVHAFYLLVNVRPRCIINCVLNSLQQDAGPMTMIIHFFGRSAVLSVLLFCQACPVIMAACTKNGVKLALRACDSHLAAISTAILAARNSNDTSVCR